MSSDRVLLFLLLIFIKHYFIDWVLQTDSMVQNKGKNIWVLFLHSIEHIAATACILFFFTPFQNIIFICSAEFVIHAAVDFAKANKKMLGRFKAPSSMYFNMLGLDQLIHYCSYLAMAWYLTLGV